MNSNEGLHKFTRFLTPLVLLSFFASGCESEDIYIGQVDIENQVVKQKEETETRDKVQYNPASCKINAEEMIYFAIGKTVFRTHYKEPIIIRGMPPERKALLPQRPDPSEPEGCPDNPIWGGGFSFAYHYQRVTNGQTMKKYAEKLSLIHILSGEKWHGQSSHELAFNNAKEKYNLCREVTNELIGCYIPLNDTEKPHKEDWKARAYQAKQELYNVPFGRLYTLSCYPGVVRDQKCNTSYRYYDDVGIAYRFSTDDIPISEIINYDRELRERIDAMHVKDYEWSESDTKMNTDKTESKENQ